jgi:hypothetical protein
MTERQNTKLEQIKKLKPISKIIIPKPQNKLEILNIILYFFENKNIPSEFR